jgi:uncharacterized protein YkwD
MGLHKKIAKIFCWSTIIIGIIFLIFIISFHASPSVFAVSITPTNRTLLLQLLRLKFTSKFSTPLPTSIISPTIIIKPTNSIQQTIIPTIKPSLIPTIIPSPTPTKVMIANTQTPVVSIPNTSQSSNLLVAVNSFRTENSRNSLTLSSNLCSIANSRAQELIAFGDLDAHAGFNKYFYAQSEFSHMGETLYQSSSFQTDSAVVKAWENSSGHRDTLLNSSYTHGCGARANNFAVFIIASI